MQMYKVETLYSGTGTVPEFWRGYQEKRCVHIGARRRIEPGHGARAPSVNTALFISNGGRFTRLNRVDLDSHFLFIKKRSWAETKSLFIDPKQLALVVWPSKC